MNATRTAALALLATLLIPTSAISHGLWAHTHVTGWAAENLPAGELRDMLLGDEEVFNALIFGAAFTDSGYFPAGDESDRARTYGEHTHWEEFIQNFVEYVIENMPPPWETQEEQKTVAFLMGCAAHGLQDEIFDTLYIAYSERFEDGNQDVLDTGTDGLFVVDGHLRWMPRRWYPTEILLDLYRELDPDITAETIDAGVSGLLAIYLNESIGVPVAEGFGKQALDRIPWSAMHYMDQTIPGSLRSEIIPTALYLEAIWERLHGRLAPDDAIVFSYPQEGLMLTSGSSDTPESWTVMIGGIGVDQSSVTATIQDEDGNPVDTTISANRWNHNPTRVLTIRPAENLEEGGIYTAQIEPGVTLADGASTTQAIARTVQVTCDDPAACPTAQFRVAHIDGNYNPTPEEPTEPTGPNEPTEGGSDTDTVSGGGSCATVPNSHEWLASLLLGLLVLRRQRGNFVPS